MAYGRDVPIFFLSIGSKKGIFCFKMILKGLLLNATLEMQLYSLFRTQHLMSFSLDFFFFSPQDVNKRIAHLCLRFIPLFFASFMSL